MASAFDERSFDDLCYAYLGKYHYALSKSVDGRLLLEQLWLNAHRHQWKEQ